MNHSDVCAGKGF